MSLAKQLSEKGRPKVIICGTRTFSDKKLLYKKMDFYTLTLVNPIIVTGGQRKRIEKRGEWLYQGADYWGEQWAHENKYLVKIFYPDWDAHGKNVNYCFSQGEFTRGIEDGKTSSKFGKPEIWTVNGFEESASTESRFQMALCLRVRGKYRSRCEQIEKQRGTELRLFESKKDRHIWESLRQNYSDKGMEICSKGEGSSENHFLAVPLHLREGKVDERGRSQEGTNYVLRLLKNSPRQLSCEEENIQTLQIWSESKEPTIRCYVPRCGCHYLLPMPLLWQETKTRETERHGQKGQQSWLYDVQHSSLLSKMQLCEGGSIIRKFFEVDRKIGKVSDELRPRCYLNDAVSIRNREMAGYVGPKGFLIAFWDGVSSGTKNMIEEARRVGMKDSRIRVVEL